MLQPVANSKIFNEYKFLYAKFIKKIFKKDNYKFIRRETITKDIERFVLNLFDNKLNGLV